jgi:hypothetical protein
MTEITVERNTALQAVHEIQNLRRRVEVLGAQVRVLDLVEALLYGRRGETAGVDIAWLLQKEIDANG